jgi:hypothetical protein
MIGKAGELATLIPASTRSRQAHSGLIWKPQANPGPQDHRDSLASSMFGRLIRMPPTPSINGSAITIERGQAGSVRIIECGEGFSRSRVTGRGVFRATPFYGEWAAQLHKHGPKCDRPGRPRERRPDRPSIPRRETATAGDPHRGTSAHSLQ